MRGNTLSKSNIRDFGTDILSSSKMKSNKRF